MNRYIMKDEKMEANDGIFTAPVSGLYHVELSSQGCSITLVEERVYYFHEKPFNKINDQINKSLQILFSQNWNPSCLHKWENSQVLLNRGNK